MVDYILDYKGYGKELGMTQDAISKINRMMDGFPIKREDFTYDGMNTWENGMHDLEGYICFEGKIHLWFRTFIEDEQVGCYWQITKDGKKVKEGDEKPLTVAMDELKVIFGK